MISDPYFSIVIPLFNKEQYIARTVKSVLNQTFESWELIIVDDGSTDDSVLRVNSFSDERVRLIRQTNSGVSAARNRGIGLARGIFVCFLDADDYWSSEYLANIYALIERHDDRGAFAARIRRVTGQDSPELFSGEAEELSSREFVIGDLPGAWRQGYIFVTSSVTVKRELLLKIDPVFPVGESLGEDMDAWFRIGDMAEWVYLDKKLVNYTVAAENSLSSVSEPRVLLPYIKRMRSRLLSGEIPQHLTRSYRSYIGHAELSLSRLLLADGLRSRSFIQLCRAIDVASSMRWWLTLLFILFVPARIAKSWEDQRRMRFIQ